MPRPLSPFLKSLLASGCVALLAGCNAAESAAPPTDAAAVDPAPVIETTADTRGAALNGLTEAQPSDFSPAFERDTVIKLNSIVQRSLDTIDAYDELRRAARASDEGGADESGSIEPAQLAALHAQAEEALGELNAEAERLRASDEVFNAAILAGMIEFSSDVEAEIASALAAAPSQ
ncbi:MAG: hypothetical protein AAFX03_02020 [Pseudomonadota bacterium]